MTSFVTFLASQQYSTIGFRISFLAYILFDKIFFFFIIILSIFLKNSLFHGQVATFLSCTKSIATRYAGGGLLDM